MGNFSFSSLGVLFLLLVLIPNACWCFKKPKDDTAERENRWLQTCEQLGQVLTTIALLIDGNLNWHGWSNRCWWLILASCFILLYEWFWVSGGSSARSNFSYPFVFMLGFIWTCARFRFCNFFIRGWPYRHSFIT